MLRVEVWLSAALIVLGVVGGLILNWPSPEARTTPDEAALTQTESDSNPGSSDADTAEANQSKSAFSLPSIAAREPIFELVEEKKVPTGFLQQGDKFLLVGNYAAAHDAYARVSNEEAIEGKVSSLLQIKLGISAEQSGFLDQAETYYRRAIEAAELRHNDRLLAVCGFGADLELKRPVE